MKKSYSLSLLLVLLMGWLHQVLGQQYCTPTYLQGASSLDHISFVQINGTSLSNTTAWAANPYYTLFPQAGSTTATLTAGTNYTLSVKGGSYNTCYIAAWIDLNQNGSFADAGEFLGISPNVGNYTLGTIPFPLSPGATGTLRLRLRSSDAAPGTNAVQPCGATNSGFGETEDYVLSIIPPVNPCVVNTLNVSTGRNPITNTVLGYGTLDNFWRLIQAPAYSASVPRGSFAIAPSSAWGAIGVPFAGSQWISGEPSVSWGANNPPPAVPYRFERCFCTASADSVTLSLSMRGDDLAYLDLVPASGATVNLMNNGGNWTIAVNYQGKILLPQGRSCLQARLHNLGSVAMGLNVQGTIAGSSIMISDSCCGNNGLIHGYKFHDLNCDGIQQTNEPLLSGWTIIMKGPGGSLDTAITDVTGRYFFTGLAAGTYILSEINQNNWQPSTPISGADTVTLSANTVQEVAFGNCLVCTSPTTLLAPPAEIGLVSGKIKWNHVPGISHYDIRYKACTDTTTRYASSTVDSVELIGLTSCTCYQVEVRGHCLCNDLQSAWSPSVTFTTACAAGGYVYADSSCENGNFDNGTCSGWSLSQYFRTGYSGISLPSLVAYGSIAGACATTELAPPYYTARHLITNSGGIDAHVPIISTTFGASLHALRLGNEVNGAEAEMITKSLHVTPYNALFHFRYAVVLQESHTGGEGYFRIEVLKGSGTDAAAVNALSAKDILFSKTIIGTASDPFVNALGGTLWHSGGAAWANNSTSFYTNWTCEEVDLRAYIGSDVTIHYIASDCAAGGHAGYAYIDEVCETCVPSTGAVTLGAINGDTCGAPFTLCGTYTLPTNGASTGTLKGLQWRLYQNGVSVKTGNVPPATIYPSTNTYCFTLNNSDFPVGNRFDIGIEADFVLGGVTFTKKNNSLHPEQGLKAGLNNDLRVNCGCACDTIRTVADFTWANVGFSQTIKFINISTSNRLINSIIYNFGDGSSQTVSSIYSPIFHTYASAGNKTITMTVVITLPDGSTCNRVITKEICVESRNYMWISPCYAAATATWGSGTTVTTATTAITFLPYSPNGNVATTIAITPNLPATGIQAVFPMPINPFAAGITEVVTSGHQWQVPIALIANGNHIEIKGHFATGAVVDANGQVTSVGKIENFASNAAITSWVWAEWKTITKSGYALVFQNPVTISTQNNGTFMAKEIRLYADSANYIGVEQMWLSLDHADSLTVMPASIQMFEHFHDARGEVYADVLGDTLAIMTGAGGNNGIDILMTAPNLQVEVAPIMPNVCSISVMGTVNNSAMTVGTLDMAMQGGDMQFSMNYGTLASAKVEAFVNNMPVTMMNSGMISLVAPEIVSFGYDNLATTFYVKFAQATSISNVQNSPMIDELRFSTQSAAIIASKLTKCTITTDTTLLQITAESNIGILPVPPIPSITASNNTVCSGTQILLTAVLPAGVTGIEYLWIKDGIVVNSSTTPTYIINVGNQTAAYHYAVCVRYTGYNYLSANSLPIIFNVFAPIATITPSGPTTFCANMPTILNATAGYSNYVWKRGNTIVGTNMASYVPIITGNHSVTITDSNGCSKTSAGISIVRNALPTANAGLDKNLCQGSSITIGAANNVANTYSWSPSTHLSNAYISNPISSATSTATYTVTVTRTSTGCANTDAMTLTSLALPPTPTVASAVYGNSYVLTPTAPGAVSVNWYRDGLGLYANKVPNASITVPNSTPDKAYTAKSKGANGCLSAASTAISVRLGATENVLNTYPNPTTGLLNVIITNSEVATGKLLLYNNLGQVVLSQEINLLAGQANVELDISHLAAGIYSLSFDHFVQKVVKE